MVIFQEWGSGNISRVGIWLISCDREIQHHDHMKVGGKVLWVCYFQLLWYLSISNSECDNTFSSTIYYQSGFVSDESTIFPCDITELEVLCGV